jgi:hypothetical protein
MHRFPAAIRRYLEDTRQDDALLSQCFAPDAVVVDEGLLYVGLESIAAWQRDFRRRYPGHRLAPVSVGRRNGGLRARLRMTGPFAGSPRDFIYRFGMRGMQIASMHID